MKKIIFSMVFVFATVSFVNANSKVESNTVLSLDSKTEVLDSCDEAAFDAGESEAEAGGSDESIFNHMNLAYALCMGYSWEEIDAAGNI